MTPLIRRFVQLRMPACIALLAVCPPVLPADVYGTAYTVLLRGHAPPTATSPRPMTPGIYPVLPQQRPAPARPQQHGLMRLVVSRGGQELATASYDSRLDGYLFRLPMAVDVSRGPVCLVLKNASGASIPVRDARGTDDGFAFRNAAWEAEAARVGDLRELRSELANLNARVSQEAAELDRLQTDAGGIFTPQDCPLGPAEPDPARPAAALAGDDAARLSGAVCALVWEQAFGRVSVDAGRLFGDAGASSDWSTRESARAVADAMPSLKLSVDERDSRLITDAAVKGRAYLEHADGVRAFIRVHASCKQDVARRAALEVQKWNAATDLARQAPQRSKARCEQRAARIQQLLATQGKATPYRTELERRIAQLERTPPAGADSVRIDNASCKEL
jgi:hypothetical protein